MADDVERAEHLIRRAKDHEDSALNLSSLTLSEVPESIRDLPELTSLALCSYALESVPLWIGELTNLETLEITGWSWSRTPKARLAPLPGLDSIGFLTGLINLELSDNRLSSLDDWVGQLTLLEELDLAGNPIKSLPSCLESVRTLKSLRLSRNMSALPVLTPYQNLRQLTISHCNLTALPPWLGDLSSLAHLHLRGNRLTALPDHLIGLTQLSSIDLMDNGLEVLPSWFGDLEKLVELNLASNSLHGLPESISSLTLLGYLDLSDNNLSALPSELGHLPSLVSLDLSKNPLTSLPEDLPPFPALQYLYLNDTRVKNLPRSLPSLPAIETLEIDGNPLPPEILGAAGVGTDELLKFLEELYVDGVSLREAKLILVGEGEVGKSTLLGALRNEKWVAYRDPTHGVEVKPVLLDDPDGVITLNGWDFGGQPVYRPTHQLFFSDPALYLVVWKPRQGPEASYVEYWLKTIRDRAGSDVRVLVVATHADNGLYPHIDEAALRDRYGDMIVGFHHVDSRTGTGLEDLREAIRQAVRMVPHLDRSYPRSWLQLRTDLQDRGMPFLAYSDYEAAATEHGLSAQSSRALAVNAHALGHWVHYADYPGLSDIVVLSGDWLSRAIAAVLDDPETVANEGLLVHGRLPAIWHEYPSFLQQLLLALMERFELSYRIEDPTLTQPVSLVSQLVRTTPPDLAEVWESFRPETELGQLCEISAGSEPDLPEGLVFRLIVRFHPYSIGRREHARSVHWAGGFLLENRYGNRALVTLERDRVAVRVRGAYPEGFLHQVVGDLSDYVEGFWSGLAVRILVPCRTNCGLGRPGLGLFEISKLLDSRDRGRPEYPCPARGCDTWQPVGSLLSGVEDRRAPLEERLVAMLASQTEQLTAVADSQLRVLLEAVSDEGRDAPRLFTLTPVEGTALRPGWATRRMILTLWDEHSRLPLHLLSGTGVYEVDIPRDWWAATAPWLRRTAAVLRTLLPVGFDIAGLQVGDAKRKALEEQLTLAEDASKAVAEAVSKVAAEGDSGMSEIGERPARAEGGVHRMLRTLLNEKDPTFGGLLRVVDPTTGRYVWVHPRFESYYRPPLPEIPT